MRVSVVRVRSVLAAEMAFEQLRFELGPVELVSSDDTGLMKLWDGSPFQGGTR